MQDFDAVQTEKWRIYLQEGGTYRLLQSFISVGFVLCQGYLLPEIFHLGVLVSLLRNPLWICSGVCLVISNAVLDYMEFEVLKHPHYIPSAKLDPLRRQIVIPNLYKGFFGADVVFRIWQYRLIAIMGTATIAVALWFIGLPSDQTR